ncbi:MAG: cell division topological specificity factor MinE [Candidatus Sericytochromatia bacterium]|nr:cell division topological specificity factor MinE [Candidatus Sericytochromatia bacterium]
MGLGSFLGRLLGRSEAVSSRSAATDRLKLVLMHDRTDIPATMMEAIRTEMVAVLSKYVEIDTEALDVQLEREQGAIGLVLNIPIKRVKTELEAAEALETMHAVQLAQEAGPEAPPGAREGASEPAVASEGALAPDGQQAEPAAPGGAEEASGAGLEPEAVKAAAAPDGAPATETPARGQAEPEASRTSSPAVIEVAQPVKTVTLPARRLGGLKGPDVGALLQKVEDDGEERPKVARDAWYTAEALLAPTPSERGEPSD